MTSVVSDVAWTTVVSVGNVDDDLCSENATVTPDDAVTAAVGDTPGEADCVSSVDDDCLDCESPANEVGALTPSDCVPYDSECARTLAVSPTVDTAVNSDVVSSVLCFEGMSEV